MNDVIDMPDKWKIAGHDEVTGMPTENEGLIITGLGGNGKQLRYFIVIPVRKKSVLKSGFKTKAKKAFRLLFSQTMVNLEDVIVRSDHLRLMLLINMDSSVDEIVMPFIQKMNSDSSQLFEHYLVVNTSVLEDKEIQ